jgi:hypothetical protein
MMLKKEGEANPIQFWTLHVPEEHCNPGLEVTIMTTQNGLVIGGGIITWEELETAKRAIINVKEWSDY